MPPRHYTEKLLQLTTSCRAVLVQEAVESGRVIAGAVSRNITSAPAHGLGEKDALGGMLFPDVFCTIFKTFAEEDQKILDRSLVQKAVVKPEEELSSNVLWQSTRER